MRLRQSFVTAAFVLACLAGSAAVAQPVSDVMKVKRPAGGEYFGLYLMDKKVGYIFNDVALLPGSPAKVQSRTEFYIKANVGQKVSERRIQETRVYEAKPGGRLLTFKVQQVGDGGDQLLEGTATPNGLTVVRKRPGHANQVFNLPPSRERVEDADQVRVALLRKGELVGHITDSQDLQTYRVRTVVSAPEERTIGGVRVKLAKAETLSDKEKVPVHTFVADNGRVVEIRFGESMSARAEPEAVAKRHDVVELFGLTRVVLPKKLPDAVRNIPAAMTMVVTGLPEKFRKDTYRQKFKAVGGDKVQVTLTAAPPKLEKKVERPVNASGMAEYLKSTLAVEADNKEIRDLAQKIVGGEKDAYAAARKIVAWVGANMVKDYGSSADRSTDVLRQMRGDCTEHSLLAVALLRASGIPARRVDGVVYLMNEDKVPALYWHEWVEAYVGEWTQLDPTFNQLVADATHFGVGEEGNAEITVLIGSLKVHDVRVN